MKVKWHNKLSTQHDLLGGGPQGSTLGLIEYDSQSNDNTDFLHKDDKYKFVDNLSVLVLINLITAGLASYNFREHVASDGIDQLFLPTENVPAQKYMDNISRWTEKNKMQLNEKKSNLMVFIYTRDYQFATRVTLNNSFLDVLHETRLLGSAQT